MFFFFRNIREIHYELISLVESKNVSKIQQFGRFFFPGKLKKKLNTFHVTYSRCDTIPSFKIIWTSLPSPLSLALYLPPHPPPRSPCADGTHPAETRRGGRCAPPAVCRGGAGAGATAEDGASNSRLRERLSDAGRRRPVASFFVLFCAARSVLFEGQHVSYS